MVHRLLLVLSSLAVLGTASTRAQSPERTLEDREEDGLRKPRQPPEPTFEVLPVIALRHYQMTVDDLERLADHELLFVWFKRKLFSDVDRAATEANGDLILLNPQFNVGVVRVRSARSASDSEVTRSKLEASPAVIRVEPGHPKREWVRELALLLEKRADAASHRVDVHAIGAPARSNTLYAVKTLVAELRKSCPRRNSAIWAPFVFTINGATGFMTNVAVKGLDPASAACLQRTFRRRPYWAGLSSLREHGFHVIQLWD